MIVRLGEEELLLPAAVEARGDRNGLAIAGLEEFKLAEVDGLADGVVDEGLRVGLLHGRHDFGKRTVTEAATLACRLCVPPSARRDFAVNDVGVGAGGGAVEGPLEFSEGEGQSAEGDVAVGARIAQALGFDAR